jgi:hypothetical protein
MGLSALEGVVFCEVDSIQNSVEFWRSLFGLAFPLRDMLVELGEVGSKDVETGWAVIRNSMISV